MAYLAEIHNTGSRSTILDCEAESAIADAAASSLSAATAAAVALRKIDGATREQLLIAAIELLRGQADRHAEALDELHGDLERTIADHEEEIGKLRAKAKKAAARRAP